MTPNEMSIRLSAYFIASTWRILRQQPDVFYAISLACFTPSAWRVLHHQSGVVYAISLACFTPLAWRVLRRQPNVFFIIFVSFCNSSYFLRLCNFT